MKTILSLILILGLISPSPVSAWEEYCLYHLQKDPNKTEEEEYIYFLDCYSGGDEYHHQTRRYQ